MSEARMGITEVAAMVGDKVVERAAWRVAGDMIERGDREGGHALESHLPLDGVDWLIELDETGCDLSEVIDRALADAAQQMAAVVAA